jgi:hypothetical protein
MLLVSEVYSFIHYPNVESSARGLIGYKKCYK